MMTKKERQKLNEMNKVQQKHYKFALKGHTMCLIAFASFVPLAFVLQLLK